MSILTTEQYLEDADCPELSNHSSFTLISSKDGKYGSFFDAVADKICPLAQEEEFWAAYDQTMTEVSQQLGITLGQAYEMDCA